MLQTVPCFGHAYGKFIHVCILNLKDSSLCAGGLTLLLRLVPLAAHLEAAKRSRPRF